MDENFNDFAEKIDDELEYKVIVLHNGQEVAHVDALSLETLQEQFHKLDKPINEYINSAYQDLPDHDWDYYESEVENLGNNGEPIKEYDREPDSQRDAEAERQFDSL